MSAPRKEVTLGLIQMRCTADAEANVEKAIAQIRRAAQAGAQIVCLQELFRTPYFCQAEDAGRFDLAEAIPGPTSGRLAKVAKEAGVVLIASLFERRSAGVYHNTAAIIDADGSPLGLYRKMHIPDDPLYYEKYYFTPGDLGFRAFDTRFGRIGVLVCWDQWFPEGARMTALKGAEILFYPTAIGCHPADDAAQHAAQKESWELIQRSHAIANGVFVAAVNRVGFEPTAAGQSKEGLNFWGGSFVCDPQGVVLRRGPADAEENLIVPCDLTRLEAVRRNWPFLRDRRIDAYGDLTRRVID
jgi:N-carbamoylputrescine amidase